MFRPRFSCTNTCLHPKSCRQQKLNYSTSSQVFAAWASSLIAKRKSIFKARGATFNVLRETKTNLSFYKNSKGLTHQFKVAFIVHWKTRLALKKLKLHLKTSALARRIFRKTLQSKAKKVTRCLSAKKPLTAYQRWFKLRSAVDATVARWGQLPTPAPIGVLPVLNEPAQLGGLSREQNTQIDWLVFHNAPRRVLATLIALYSHTPTLRRAGKSTTLVSTLALKEALQSVNFRAVQHPDDWRVFTPAIRTLELALNTSQRMEYLERQRKLQICVMFKARTAPGTKCQSTPNLAWSIKPAGLQQCEPSAYFPLRVGSSFLAKRKNFEDIWGAVTKNQISVADKTIKIFGLKSQAKRAHALRLLNLKHQYTSKAFSPVVDFHVNKAARPSRVKISHSFRAALAFKRIQAEHPKVQRFYNAYTWQDAKRLTVYKERRAYNHARLREHRRLVSILNLKRALPRGARRLAALTSSRCRSVVGKSRKIKTSCPIHSRLPRQTYRAFNPLRLQPVCQLRLHTLDTFFSLLQKNDFHRSRYRFAQRRMRRRQGRNFLDCLKYSRRITKRKYLLIDQKREAALRRRIIKKLPVLRTSSLQTIVSVSPLRLMWDIAQTLKESNAGISGSLPGFSPTQRGTSTVSCHKKYVLSSHPRRLRRVFAKKLPRRPRQEGVLRLFTQKTGARILASGQKSFGAGIIPSRLKKARRMRNFLRKYWYKKNKYAPAGTALRLAVAGRGAVKINYLRILTKFAGQPTSDLLKRFSGVYQNYHARTKSRKVFCQKKIEYRLYIIRLTRLKQRGFARVNWRQQATIRRLRDKSLKIFRITQIERRGRALIWPINAPKKHRHWLPSSAMVDEYRTRSSSALATSYYSGASPLKPLSYRLRLMTRYARAQHAVTKKIQPYYNLNFTLRARKWHRPRNNSGFPAERAWLTRAEKQRRSLINEIRFFEKNSLLRKARHADTAAEARLLREKANRPHLQRATFRDPTWRALELRLGYPATLAYARRRRVFRGSYNATNRWSRAVAVGAPRHNSFALVPVEQQPAAFRSHSKYTKYYTTRTLWNNEAWRNLSKGITNLTPRTDTTAYWAFAKNTVVTIMKGQARLNIWAKYARVTGSTKEAYLRFVFLRNEARTWLRSRPSEQVLTRRSAASWNLRLSQEFPNTASRKSVSRLDHDLKTIRAQHLEVLRQQLFSTQPDWWQKEAKYRIQIFSELVSELVHSKKQYTNAEVYTLLQNRLRTQSRIGEQEIQIFETKIRTFLKNTLPQNYRVAENISLRGSNKVVYSDDFKDKNFGVAYQYWARGIKSYLKKASVMTVPIRYDRTSDRLSVEHPFDAARFPAAGDRINSFDRARRVFYRKVMYSSFRRVSARHFQTIRPSTLFHAAEIIPGFERTSVIAAKRRQVRRLTKNAYRTLNWRSLLLTRQGRRHTGHWALAGGEACGQRASGLKRRFAPLPFSLCEDEVTERRLQLPIVYYESFTGETEGLLRHALNTRALTRRFQDLKTRVSRRALSPEQITPPWITTKKSHEEIAVDNLESFIEAEDNERDFFYSWTRDERTPIINVREKLPYKPILISSSGEILHVTAVSQRISWANEDYRPQKRSCFRQATLVAQGLKKQENVYVSKRKARPGARRRVSQYLHPRFQNLRRRRRWWKKPTKHEHLLRRWRRKHRPYLNKPLVARRRFRPLYQKRTAPQLSRVRTMKKRIRRRKVAPLKTSVRLQTDLVSGAVLVPFIFRKKDTTRKRTEQQRRSYKRFKASRQRGAYARTTEYAETLTAFFPTLISWLRKRQLRGGKLSSVAAKNYVRTVYYNLRVYLGQNFFDERLVAADKTVDRRHTVRKERATIAAARYFDSARENNMRSRRQPAILFRKGPLGDGALIWLRSHFPRLYKIYLEDATDFKALAPNPTKVLRVQPGSQSAINWTTFDIATPRDHTFSHLVTASREQDTSRFEHILATARRPTITAGAGGAGVHRLSKARVGASTRNSFFSKSFSTSTKNTRYNPILSTRIELRQRLIEPANQQRTDHTAVVAHLQIKQQVTGRGRSQSVKAVWESACGSLDPRLHRAKSPRSRQYLQRQHQKQNLLAGFASQNMYSLQRAARRRENKTVARSSRLFTADHTTKVTVKISSLSSVRSEYKIRRLPTNLKVQTYTYLETLKFPTHTPIFTPKKRKLSPKKQLADSNALLEKSPNSFATNRAILHFRRAEHRSPHRFYRRARRLSLTGRISLSDAYKNTRSTSFFKTQYLLKKLKTLLPHTVSAFQAQNYISLAQRLRQTQCSAKSWRARQRSRLYGARPTFQREKIVRNRGILTPIKTQASRLFELGGRFTPIEAYSKKPLTYLTHLQAEKISWPGVNRINIRRSEFLGRLIGRHFLKARVLKTWIKERKRLLIRTNWKCLSEKVFKERRTRLRLLEWHESDQHFFREGWNQAFKFYASEQQRAPWLQPIRRRRSMYSFRHGEYRRYAFPREQKRLKWLQHYRKSRVSFDPARNFLKGRRWPRLSTAVHRLARGLFEFRNTRTAQRHFKKLSKTTTTTTGFSQSLVGLGNRLDVNLLLLGIFPTIFWARRLAPLGLLQVNGIEIVTHNHLLQPGDVLNFHWDKIHYLQAEFTPDVPHYDEHLHSSFVFDLSTLPGNFTQLPQLGRVLYRRLPRPEDIEPNSRICQWLFDAFRREAGVHAR